MKMKSSQRAFIAPEVHHFRPLMTRSSPSRMMRLLMLVASEDATSGSVIAKPERISPFRSGRNHRSFCSGGPKRSRISMFPVSGAEQLKTSEAHGTFPLISQSGAYSRLVSPAPRSDSGRKRFHSPADRALDFSSSTTGGGRQ